MNLVFFVRVTLIKIANTPLDRSAACFIRIYCITAAALATGKSNWKFGQSWTWPDFRKIADFGFAGAEMQHKRSIMI